MTKKILVLTIVTLICGFLVAQYSGEGTFVRVTDLEDLTTGYYVVLGSNAGHATNPQPGAVTVNNAMNTTYNNTFLAVTGVIQEEGYIVDPSNSIVWFIEQTEDYFTIYHEDISMYVSYTGSANNVQLVNEVTSDNQRWEITNSPHGSGEHNFYRVRNLGIVLPGRALMYNYTAGQERFACYNLANTNMADLALFKLAGELPDLVATPTFTPPAGVYTTLQNVTISTTTPGAVIYYTTDGSTPDETSTLYTDPIPVSTTTTVRARAYEESLEPSNIASATYTFPFPISNLTEIRAVTPGTHSIYVVTGEVIVSMFQAFNSQKYLQDDGAAIMIHDPSGIITTEYAIGDGITNLIGTVSLYNDMLQLVPTQDPGPASSTDNELVPTIVTIANLITDLEAYQSRLVEIENAIFAITGTFTTGVDYVISDATGIYTFRTNFYDADYIGSPIPVGPVNIAGMISTRNTGSHIAARFQADFSTFTPPPEFYPPRNLEAEAGDGVVVLTWEIPDITRQLVDFTVYRNNIALPNDVEVTIYFDETVQNNTTYTYYVVANYMSPAGTSAPSNTATAHTLFPVRNLSYSIEYNNVHLAWVAPTGGGANGYNIYRDEVLMTPQPVTTPEFVDTTTEAETQYIYEVTAVYTAGESAPIALILVTGEEYSLLVTPPRNLNASIGNGFVYLTWLLPELVPGIEGLDLHSFIVYRDDIMIADDVFTTFYTDTTVENQTAYEYHVTALFYYQGSEIESGPSNPVNLTTRFPARSLIATSQYYDVLLDWLAPVSGTASGYNVYRNDVLLTASPITAITFTDDDTTPAEQYTYRVHAVYEGVESPGIAAVITIPLFNPPRTLSAQVNNYTVSLSWLAPEEILDFEVLLGYKVYRDDELLTPMPLAGLTLTDMVTDSGEYTYKVLAVYELGDSVPIEAIVTIDVSDKDITGLPLITELKGNYPNPFNPETTIKFDLAVASNLQIDIFNIRGQKVKTLVNKEYAAGYHSVVWNGTDDNGNTVGSGIYFYQMSTSEYSAIKRMIMMK